MWMPNTELISKAKQFQNAFLLILSGFSSISKQCSHIRIQIAWEVIYTHSSIILSDGSVNYWLLLKSLCIKCVFNCHIIISLSYKWYGLCSKSLSIGYKVHMQNRKLASGMTLAPPLSTCQTQSQVRSQFQPHFFQAITYLLARPHN